MAWQYSRVSTLRLQFVRPTFGCKHVNECVSFSGRAQSVSDAFWVLVSTCWRTLANASGCTYDSHGRKVFFGGCSFNIGRFSA